MTCLSDTFSRPINYLRVSVTDRCNLRCVYCMPSEGIHQVDQCEILRYEELLTIIGVAAELGISKIRVTGGEPLVRAGLVDFIRMLSQVKGIDDIALTTNAVLLAKYAEQLKQAGLARVNVSLDSLREKTFKKITRYGSLKEVLKGIDQARKVGLWPVKINVVVVRGLNDEEVLDFAKKTVEEEWHVRFIEVMPFADDHFTVVDPDIVQTGFVPISEIFERISTLGELEPSEMQVGNGPAKYYRLPGAKGTLGFISPVSEHFCFNCNRLRLTADGRLRPCLLSSEEVELKSILRQGASREELKEQILRAVEVKPRQHLLAENTPPSGRLMAQIGG